MASRRAYYRWYHIANREKRNAQSNEYWEANGDRLNALAREKRRLNKDKPKPKRKKLSPEKACEINLVKKVARNLGTTHAEARRQLGLVKEQRPTGPT